MRLIFEKSKEKIDNHYIKKPAVSIKEPKEFIPASFLREKLPLPSLSENEVVRHYLNLAKKNFCVDTNFYPLGSCTMKYNPKVNEELAQIKEFLEVHPFQKEDDFQGCLEIIYNLEKILCEITGMKRFSFQPCSGAQAELCGMLIIKKYHQLKGRKKTKVIVPDSSHGTNPASAKMAGFDIVVLESNSFGLVDVEKLEKIVNQDTAALMLTNPNTLGLFEEEILKISQILHQNDALLYYDGANFNPLLGITKPSLMGFDVIHLNLHKTFSTPHGSGGPGVGAIGVREELVDFLPAPLVEKDKDRFYLNWELKHSVGKFHAFFGNFLVLIKSYAYLLRLGKEGLKKVAQVSVINANYIRKKLEKYYLLSSPKPNMHEVVFSCKKQKEKGASCLDICKRLIDYGIHPPTMYFPLIVKEALMVEPTETESKEVLDKFIQTLIEIDKEIQTNLEKVKNAPHSAFVKRVDEIKAARFPILRWKENGV
jgi:glycine dehydrogenase subunit 2